MSKSPLVVLLWTLPEEPEFAAALARHHDPLWVVPLRYPALLAARKILPASAILTPSQVVAADKRRALHDETTAGLNRLWRRLRSRANEPWWGGLQYIQPVFSLYAAAYWDEFLRALPVQDPSQWRHYAPLSRIFLNGYMQGEPDLLNAHLAARSSGVVGGMRCRKTPGEWMGWLCQRTPGVSTIAEPQPARPRTPMLVCGLQSTDCVSQAPVVAGLSETPDTSFRWLVPTAQRHAIMKDEEDAAASATRERSCVDEIKLDGYGLYRARRWRHPRMQEWSRQRLSAVLERELLAVVERPGVKAVVPLLARSIANCNEHPFLNYASTDDLLQAYDPNTVVVSSSIDESAYMSACAAHHKRRVVMMPHGVVGNVEYHFHWDVDVAGVTGPGVAERVHEFGIVREKTVLVGGVHVARQGQAAANVVAEARRSEPRFPRRALFLLANTYGFEFPDAVDELECDLSGMVKALEPLGWTLALRCHPRSNDASSMQVMVRDMAGRGLEVEWSDGRSSLAADLARSGLAITRTWDGASVTTLFAGVSLAGWLARPSHRQSDLQLHKLPLVFKTIEDVAHFAGCVADSPERVRVLQAQRAVLEASMSGTAEPPFDASIRLLRDEVQRAVQASRA